MRLGESLQDRSRDRNIHGRRGRRGVRLRRRSPRMSYLADRAAFMQWVVHHTTSTAGLFDHRCGMTRSFRAACFAAPRSRNEDFKKDVRASGGDRDLRPLLQEEWKRFGFCHLRTDPLIVHSDITARKELMYMFMMTVA